MKYPYEAVGIITSVALLGTILTVGMFVMMEETEHSSSATNSIDQYIHDALPEKEAWDNYYKNNMDMQLDCKMTSETLQDFYDCVNNP